MAGTVRMVTVVHSEDYPNEVLGVYSNREAAEAIAEKRLKNKVNHKQWNVAKSIYEVLPTMLEDAPLYDYGVI